MKLNKNLKIKIEILSFKRCVNLNRSFFTQNCFSSPLGFGLELWKGAYASVRPSEVGLTWNLDSKVIYLKKKIKISKFIYHVYYTYSQLPMLPFSHLKI